jgi:IS30 family transposase
VSRELTRNMTRGHTYRACTAQTLATVRARQPRQPRKLWDTWLWQHVRAALAEGCSPEQIAGRLRRAYPGDMGRHLSVETIYGALYVLPRGALRSELLAALRQARKARRPRARGTDRRGQLPNMTSIAARPAEVLTRTVPGHWEGDLIKGHGIARLSALWWSGRHVWSSWHGWRGRMHGVPVWASRKNSGTCPPCCGKP